VSFSFVPEYFYNQSGVIPYREKKGVLQVLLVTSRKKGKWIIPKGVVEPYMTARESAAQEAYEEAGVFGEVWSEPVGSFEMDKWDGVCSVAVYPMHVEKIYENWMESGFRKRRWMSPEKALDKCGNKEMKKMIKLFLKAYEVRSEV